MAEQKLEKYAIYQNGYELEHIVGYVKVNIEQSPRAVVAGHLDLSRVMIVKWGYLDEEDQERALQRGDITKKEERE